MIAAVIITYPGKNNTSERKLLNFAKSQWTFQTQGNYVCGQSEKCSSLKQN